MRRLSIGAATTIVVILIGALFVLLSWLAGNYLREVALQSQTQSLSRIIEVASNQILHNIQNQAINLSGTLNEDNNLTQAFQQYQQGNPAPLLKTLDAPLIKGFADAGNIELAKFRVYDKDLDYLLESRAGKHGLAPRLPDFIIKQARPRKGIERLKAIGGLWSSNQGPVYSTLLPIGGLKLEGYLEVIFDPASALETVSNLTNMPLTVSLTNQALPIDEEKLELSDQLAIEYMLTGDDHKPAYRLVGIEDVRKFNHDMENQQLTTTASFIAITFIILLLILILFNRGIFMPLRNMLGGIERYRRGDVDTRITPSGLREPFTLGETFNSMIEQLQHDFNELERYSNIDGLTGLSNRRYFEQRLHEEWSRSIRHQSPLALLFIDIDYFKRYNDHYGHLRGDDCLRRVSQAIQHAVKRDIDVAARYGGEEFVIMLPGTDIAGAEQVARELQKAIRKLHIEHSGSNVEPFVTLSIGIASFIPRFPDKPDSLVHAADKALYKAKDRGRNCIGRFTATA